MINRIIRRIKYYLARRSQTSYINYLRGKGVTIGERCHFDPATTSIDVSRPSLISIGDDCYMNNNFTILTHDWVSKVFIDSGLTFIPSSGRVTIGNNCSFGINVIILKGVTIGDNCFIGAGSIVTKDIPANSVAVGNPCRVVCSIEDYYQKRLKKYEDEAFDYAISIIERFHRDPVPEDFWEEFPLFVNKDRIDAFPNIPIKKQLGKTYDDYCANHVSKYNGFEDFLFAVKKYQNNKNHQL